ncbi:MAG: hypothetical protein OHK0017_05050 [Patescibacteria group bacterium]
MTSFQSTPEPFSRNFSPTPDHLGRNKRIENYPSIALANSVKLKQKFEKRKLINKPGKVTVEYVKVLPVAIQLTHNRTLRIDQIDHQAVTATVIRQDGDRIESQPIKFNTIIYDPSLPNYSHSLNILDYQLGNQQIYLSLEILPFYNTDFSMNGFVLHTTFLPKVNSSNTSQITPPELFYPVTSHSIIRHNLVYLDESLSECVKSITNYLREVLRSDPKNSKLFFEQKGFEALRTLIRTKFSNIQSNAIILESTESLMNNIFNKPNITQEELKKSIPTIQTQLIQSPPPLSSNPDLEKLLKLEVEPQIDRILHEFLSSDLIFNLTTDLIRYSLFMARNKEPDSQNLQHEINLIENIALLEFDNKFNDIIQDKLTKIIDEINQVATSTGTKLGYNVSEI